MANKVNNNCEMKQNQKLPMYGILMSPTCHEIVDSLICSMFRDELLNKELFLSIDEIRYIADRLRMDYNY